MAGAVAPTASAALPLSERLSPNTTIELYGLAAAGRIAVAVPTARAKLPAQITPKNLRIRNSLQRANWTVGPRAYATRTNARAQWRPHCNNKSLACAG